MNDKNEKRTYIIGHTNPDTDSVVSAYAYAYLKQALGDTNCRAGRSGNANMQTEYIFNRFGVPLPKLLPDLIPKVKYYATKTSVVIEKNKSLWDALQLMTANNLELLPVVNKKGEYEALLYYESFAHYILSKATPNQKASITTSIRLIQQTLSAQNLYSTNEEVIEAFSLLVGAAYSSTFCDNIRQLNCARLIVLLGDRFDLQKFAIEQGVRLLVITNGYLLSPDLCTLAEKNGVSVIVSPYDSTTTSMMLLYSAPVQAAADAIESVTLDMPIKRIKNKITQSKSRALPVVEANSRKLWGIVTESDLMKEPNVEVILVDHNELSQSIEGVENYKVREVVDHHRLGSFKSNEPITFINRVVGSTSSIIASLYRENRVPIPKEIASLLLCGVISDTLGFKSVTTTDFDRQIAYDLATIAHLDCEAVINDLAQAADQIGKYTPHDLVNMDKKGYERDKLKYFVSQIETNDVAPFLKNHQNYLDELSKIVEEDKAFFAACLITDLGKLSSYLFIEGNADFIRALNSYPEQESNVFFMKNVLSRKKQLMPLFSEIFTGLEG